MSATFGTQVTELQSQQSPWWVKAVSYPYLPVLLEDRDGQIHYVNQCEDVDWLKKVQGQPNAKSVATAIKNRLYRLEVAWGYDVLIEFNNRPAEWFHKQGAEKDVRRWALFKSHSRGAVELKPITRKQWLACYGDGKTRM